VTDYDIVTLFNCISRTCHTAKQRIDVETAVPPKKDVPMEDAGRLILDPDLILRFAGSNFTLGDVHVHVVLFWWTLLLRASSPNHYATAISCGNFEGSRPRRRRQWGSRIDASPFEEDSSGRHGRDRTPRPHSQLESCESSRHV